MRYSRGGGGGGGGGICFGPSFMFFLLVLCFLLPLLLCYDVESSRDADESEDIG